VPPVAVADVSPPKSAAAALAQPLAQAPAPVAAATESVPASAAGTYFQQTGDDRLAWLAVPLDVAADAQPPTASAVDGVLATATSDGGGPVLIGGAGDTLVIGEPGQAVLVGGFAL
jgi:hypothetical protein